MALSLSNRRAACATASTRKHYGRPRAVVTRAGLGDAFNFVGQAFMKIFSPPQDNGVTWSGTSNSFGGRIKHDAKRPFADNYVAGGQKYSSASDQAVATTAETQAQDGRDPNVMDYVGDALERVVGHNFTGDETEPPTTTGSAGWKGDIHDRKTDGFHSRRM